jgi:hypothetical protein
MLIEWSLPDPEREPGYVPEVVKYYTNRNHQAKESHRKRTIRKLSRWPSLKKRRKKARRKHTVRKLKK